MPSRDAALAALYDRLAAARANPGLLLADDALGDAAELAATTDTTTDPSAAQALGWFHWNRHLSLPDSDGRSDLAAATSYFASVYQASPASVPAPIRQALRDREQDSAAPGADPAAANDQAVRLFSAYQGNGQFPALIDAIALFRKAAAAPGDRAVYLANLGAALQLLFGRTGDLGALTEAIEVTREAVAAAPSGDPDLARYLGNLVGALQLLFGHTGDPGALTEAIRAGHDAVAATSNGHPYRAMCLGNLGAALWTLFGRTGDLCPLSEAVRVTREAVAAAPVGDPNRAAYLKSLAGVLHAQFERTGELGALTEAVEAGRDAVAATPAGDPGRASRLNSLGATLQAQFERTGELKALTEAVQAGRDAVAATSASAPDRAAYLSNLGGALQMLLGRTGDLSALTEAVEVTREAVAAARSGDPDRAAYLSNLGATLQMLFRRTGDLGALTEAVQAGRDAVAATPASAPNRAAYLSNLGRALQMLFGHTGDLGALTEAIEVTRQAVADVPVGDPARATCQGNLGAALQVLFERTGDMGTLTEAIQVTKEALAASPSGHPSRAVHLSELGNALQTLAEHTGDTEALTEAAKCFQAVGGSTTAAVSLRISGWRRAAVNLTDRADDDALAAAEAAVELLPQLTPRSLARADREHQLSESGPLAGVAAAAAIAAGRPERAVELLEQTRSVLAANTVDARSSDLNRLRETAPELAGAFEELRGRMQALDQPGAVQPGDQAGPTAGQDLEQARRKAPDLADARHEAQADWDQLISRIRSADGFAGFLAAPSISKLAAQAQDGPIVFVSASPTRCDALILTDDPHTPVRLVPLAPLTLTDAAVQTARLLVVSRAATDPSEKPAARMTAQGEVLKVLAWIWDTITEPVLTALGHTTAPSREEPWPRVWWSPRGPLAYLPLHAAGHHSDLTAGDPALAANPRTVLDRVVSSYTTTVRSLAYARTRRPGAGNAVVVAVADAPGTQPLPGVTAETATLRRFLPHALVLADPTRDTVLDALPGHQVAHFACHGYADWEEPASSRLILRDHHTAPLTVADVSALHLTGDLAYLSACDTTVTSPRLADEAVHITGAFHLAGYQHVIGTLWPINDALARDIAEDFYADLTAGGTIPPQTSRSPRALHHAIRRLRARYPQTPTLWAAHTHTGA